MKIEGTYEGKDMSGTYNAGTVWKQENEKWMAYLDANFQKQQAQLELLKTAGQLDKVWQ